jgi:hypothetical protein
MYGLGQDRRIVQASVEVVLIDALRCIQTAIHSIDRHVSLADADPA